MHETLCIDSDKLAGKNLILFFIHTHDYFMYDLYFILLSFRSQER
jgi:hypothetical protein